MTSDQPTSRDRIIQVMEPAHEHADLLRSTAEFDAMVSSVAMFTQGAHATLQMLAEALVELGDDVAAENNPMLTWEHVYSPMKGVQRLLEHAYLTALGEGSNNYGDDPLAALALIAKYPDTLDAVSAAAELGEDIPALVAQLLLRNAMGREAIGEDLRQRLFDTRWANDEIRKASHAVQVQHIADHPELYEDRFGRYRPAPIDELLDDDDPGDGAA